MSKTQAELCLLEQVKLASRIKNSFQSVPTVHTRGMLRARLETLESNYLKFQQQHVELLKAPLEGEVTYFKDDIFTQTEEWYQVAKGKFFDAIDALASVQASNSSINVNQHVSSSSARSFPKITLPTFSGNYTEWSNFSDLFKSLIAENTEIGDVVKLHHLKTNLTGEPAQLLKNIPVTNENYKRAWDLLVKRYENKRILINSHLSILFSLKPLKSESASNLKDLVNSAEENLEALKALKCPVDHWSHFLVFHLTNLLDSQTRRDWETSLGDTTESPSYDSLHTFLEGKVRTLEILEGNPANLKDSSNSKSNEKSQASKYDKGSRGSNKSSASSSHLSTDQTQNSHQVRKCFGCGQAHFLMYCAQFRAMNAIQRKDFAGKRKLCLNCLRQHSTSECPSSRTCRLCDQKHHTMLHQDATTSNITHQSPSTQGGDRTLSSVHHLSIHNVTRPRAKGLLPTAVIKVKSISGASVFVRALLDQGSEVSLVSESLAQRLKLARSSCELGLLTISAGRPTTTHGAVSCILAPRFESDFEYPLDALVLPRLTPYRPRFEKGNKSWSHLLGLNLADPDFGNSKVIDVIIGADACPYLLLPNIRKGPSNAPVAQETYFGWTLSGKTTGDSLPKSTEEPSSVLGMHVFVQCTVAFDLQRFWEEQEIPSKSILTSEEQECEDFFVSTHSRTPEGRYVVRLPMKKDISSFGNSFRPAFRMLQRMERRLASDASFLRAYQEFLKEYESLGHMMPDTESSIRRDSSRSFHLPHHGVLRESSATTKLRVVFNGSQKTEAGVSLNECLHTGATLLPNLVDILLRWRCFRIALCADVEKMYRQILVHRDDQDLQLILWRNSPNDAVQTFRLTTVTYGLSCAPFLALRCIQQLALDEGKNYPKAAEVVLRGTYVDDVITGADNFEDAISLQNQLHRLFTAGGFPLRKWMSSDSDLLEKIPNELRASSQPLSLEFQQSFHMLGLSWNPLRDVITFDVQLPACPDVITKRTVLSQIAQLFDPLGWLSPVIITAKILIQTLWLLKISWDDPLPNEVRQRWLAYRGGLRDISSIEVPRWIKFSSSSGSCELHGFSDASERAFAAAVYLLVTSDSDTKSVSLLISKTKVAPLKQISLPRLELCGAVLLVRLMHHVQQTLLLDVPIHLWCDSTVTLAWIHGHPTKWKTFIANRVSEIQTTLPSAIWHHVSSSSNPADCASRGLSAKELSSFSLWWQGPNWLPFPDLWPRIPSSVIPEVDLEERTLRVHTSSCVPAMWVLLHRYSSLDKLLRATAWLQRFIQHYFQQSCSKSSFLSPSELKKARLDWIRHEQQFYFEADIKALSSGRSLPSKSNLGRLTPYLDSQQLLRVGGRLKNSALDPDEKHPLILSSESTLTNLLIDHHHRRCLHGGVQLTLGTLRQTYWILRGRSVVRAFIHRCLPCLRHRAVKPQQLMADLPAIRSTPSRPFLHTGVDYAGPVYLRTTKGRGHRSYKGYIAVFVCCSTRAVHLEAVSDYTADAFLAAYYRFVSRRGICATLTSDQGTNFVGADVKLRAMFSAASKESNLVASYLASYGTEWRFNPPGAPHFGGIWEAAVKSAKHHLRRVIGDTTLTYEEMSTFLVQVEACLNSRPLQSMSDDPDDLTALTPGHFLIGESLNSIPEPSYIDIASNRLSRWQLLQQMRQHFWQRWSSDYLKELQPRSKWRTPYPSLEVGDLAFIRDENSPPTKWPLGRVVELHTGSDGHVRVVSLRTASGLFKRPIVKLCLLPKAKENVEISS